MDRRSFHRGLVLTALTPAFAGCARAGPSTQAQDDHKAAAGVHRRAVTEYALPPAQQTHELIKLPDAALVLVSQQSGSQLVKLWLDPTTEQITGIQGLPPRAGRRDAARAGPVGPVLPNVSSTTK